MNLRKPKIFEPAKTCNTRTFKNLQYKNLTKPNILWHIAFGVSPYTAYIHIHTSVKTN